MLRTPIDIKDANVVIADGGSGTNRKFVRVRIGNGNLTWSEKKSIEYIRDRGRLDTARTGEEMPLEMRLDATWITITQDTANSANEAITPSDAMKKEGGAAAWLSTAADPCEPYAVDVEVSYDPTCSGFKSEIIIFPDFRYESIEHDLKAGTLVFSGKCNATEPTVSRVTNPATLPI